MLINYGFNNIIAKISLITNKVVMRKRAIRSKKCFLLLNAKFHKQRMSSVAVKGV